MGIHFAHLLWYLLFELLGPLIHSFILSNFSVIGLSLYQRVASGLSVSDFYKDTYLKARLRTGRRQKKAKVLLTFEDLEDRTSEEKGKKKAIGKTA